MNYTRNKEIHDLCWANNKYVKKRKKVIPNIGFKTLENSGYKIFDEKFNSIQNTNVAHGFKPGNGFPKIELRENIDMNNNAKFNHVVDTQAFSIFNNPDFSYDKNSFSEKIKYYSSNSSYRIIYPNLYPSNENSGKILEVKNLSMLISILLSTNTFVCLNSGSHVLASALKNITGFPKNIISFNTITDFDVEIINEKILSKKGQFYFDNVSYEKIEIVKKNISKEKNNELQNIGPNMRKSLARHRKLFYYQKKISKIFSI